jgi:hypothetical protein
MEENTMNEEKTDRLARLNAYQIAALALVSSSVVAVAVLLLFRRSKLSQPAVAPEAEIPIQPAISTSAPVDIPTHFSEDLLIPGLTHTGAEIAEQDREEGRSTEGV